MNSSEFCKLFKSDTEAEYALKERLIELARDDILTFTMLTKPDYRVNWHHRLIADKLNAFVRGEIKFLMIFTAPRHGKSELVSRRLPAFIHGKYPDDEIMAVSYLDSLASDMTMDVQKVIDLPIYQEIFPDTKIPKAGVRYTQGIRNASEHSILNHRGKYRGQGVGGSFTGRGTNWISIDDPVKGREIADSVAYSERLWNFYLNDLFSRLETNLENGRQGQILITQTRWTEIDLSGRLLEQMKKDSNAIQWEILSLPAIREDMDDPNDPRQIGEALWPEKYDIDRLNRIKASIGDRAWGSLYQQNPRPAGGTIFKPEMFSFCEVPEELDYSFATVDTAYTEKQESDFTVVCIWGVRNEQLFLRDIWKRQIKAVDVEAPMKAFIQRYVSYGYRATLIEPKGHGIYLNQAFATENMMIPSDSDLAEFFRDRRMDKVERANNVVPHLATRKVYINVNLTEKEDLVNEACAFPKVKHDDFTDCMIDSLKKTYGSVPTSFDIL